MRLLIKLDYNTKYLTRELSTGEVAAFLKAIDGGAMVTETYVSATNSYRTEVVSGKDFEVETLFKGSNRVPELPLRQLAIEAVIEKEAEEAKVSTADDGVLF